MRVIQGSAKGVRAVAFSPDGGALAAAGYDGVVRLWDFATFAPTKLGSFGATPMALAWTPDGQQFVWSQGSVASTAGSVWRTTRAGETSLLYSSINAGPVGGVGVSPDGRTLYAAVPRAIKRWEPDGTPLDEWPAVSPGCLAVGPDGRTVASTHPLVLQGEKHAAIWDVETGQVRKRLTDCRERFAGLAFSPDGTRLAAIGHQSLWLWELPSGKVVCSHPSKKFYTGVAFAPDGRTLATTGNDGLVRLWDAASGDPLKTFDWQVDKALCVAFAPDGTRAAVGGARGAIVVWDAD